MHCLITTKSVIQITGEDSQKFLQGQLTANLEELDTGASTLACQCSAKGKTWAIYQVIAFQDKYLLVTDQGCAENGLRELKKYAVFSKVDIQDVTEQYQLFGLLHLALPPLALELPAHHLESRIVDNATVITRFDIPELRWQVLQLKDAPQLPPFPPETAMSESQWDIMDIQAGLPKLGTAQSEEYVPQMMNMQALNAISFKKGCYMGQEVVARTKYLGKNKRAGAILKCETATRIEAGDTFELQLGENWRRIGTCLYGATTQDTSWAFAVLPNDLQANAVFRLKSNPDAIFSMQALPYQLD